MNEFILRYQQGESNQCPECGCEDYYAGSFDMEGDMVFQECSCNECGCEWIDCYGRVSLEIRDREERIEPAGFYENLSADYGTFFMHFNIEEMELLAAIVEEWARNVEGQGAEEYETRYAAVVALLKRLNARAYPQQWRGLSADHVIVDEGAQWANELNREALANDQWNQRLYDSGNWLPPLPPEPPRDPVERLGEYVIDGVVVDEQEWLNEINGVNDLSPDMGDDDE